MANRSVNNHHQLIKTIDAQAHCIHQHLRQTSSLSKKLLKHTRNHKLRGMAYQCRYHLTQAHHLNKRLRASLLPPAQPSLVTTHHIRGSLASYSITKADTLLHVLVDHAMTSQLEPHDLDAYLAILYQQILEASNFLNEDHQRSAIP